MRRFIPLLATAALGLMLAVPAGAQTIDPSSQTQQVNTSLQGRYGITATCPGSVTINVPFPCTLSNLAGTSVQVSYVIRKVGGQSQFANPKAANKALARVIPLSYFIGVSERLWNEQKLMQGATMTCPDTATSASQRVTCTLTAPTGGSTAQVTMRFKPTKPFGWVLVPTSNSAFSKAIKSLG